MLGYFRYFIFLSVIVLAGGAYLLGAFLQDTAARIFILEPGKRESVFFAERVEDKLVCRFAEIFTDEQLVATARKENFRKLAGLLIGLAPYDKITLYNGKGSALISSNSDDIVLLNADDDKSIAGALSGNSHDALVISGTYSGSDQSNQIRKYHARYVVPLQAQNCPGAKGYIGAIEFFADADRLRDKISDFRLLLTAGVVAVFVFLYIALYISSRRHEKVINKQHEEKMQLEKAKTVAEMKSREKSMFLANITHELRTPLNAIIGFSEILKEGVIHPEDGGKYQEYVKDIHSSGVHLLGLINDILDYSKAEASKLEVDMVDMDLRKIALNCLRLVEPRASDADLRLIADIPKRNLLMKGDPKRIKQVILNLLSNAVKFTPAGGEVTLSITEEPTEEMIEINIVDTGIGIPKKQISKALAPFGQVESGMSKQEGTGLGLPLTKKLTEIMGGEFIFQSEKDLGTSITIRFPYHAVDLEKHKLDF